MLGIGDVAPPTTCVYPTIALTYGDGIPTSVGGGGGTDGVAAGGDSACSIPSITTCSF